MFCESNDEFYYKAGRQKYKYQQLNFLICSIRFGATIFPRNQSAFVLPTRTAPISRGNRKSMARFAGCPHDRRMLICQKTTDGIILERGWVIRIISCRKATLMERKAYEEN
jgi:hypothetical protein